MPSFTIDMSTPFASGYTGPKGGPHIGTHSKSPLWYNASGMDLGAKEGTELLAVFTGHVTDYREHNPKEDKPGEYGAKIFMRSDKPNDGMGVFYTHITDVPSKIAIGAPVKRGEPLGKTMRDHLHMALVEVLPSGKKGADNLYDLLQSMCDAANPSSVTTVTFKQNGSPPSY